MLRPPSTRLNQSPEADASGEGVGRLASDPVPITGAALIDQILDADRRLHGPYTLAAGLLELLVPEALRRWPELVHARDLEIRAAAPRLRPLVPARRTSLADSLPQGERILVPAPRRTLRLANGLAEFVRDHLRLSGSLRLIVLNADEADPTDQEFLRVLARRVDPGLLTPLLDSLLDTELRLLGTGYPEPLEHIEPPDPTYMLTVALSGDTLADWLELPGDTDRARLLGLLRRDR